jgi:very-short-patch-repair endonuclease
MVDPLVEAFQKRIYAKLIDSTRNNPLLYYKDSKSTRFAIDPPDSEFIASILSGKFLRASDFRGNATDLEQRASRLSKLRAKAREFEEERGVRTLYVAVGMVTWKARDGGRDPLSPLFLVPVEIVQDPRRRGDLALQQLETAEIILNRTLRFRAPQAFADALSSAFDGGTVDDPLQGLDEVERIIASNALEITLVRRCALGIFNFGYLAMIEDINGAGELLSQNDVIRALADDIDAQQRLIGSREGAVALSELDRIPPVNEPFVLDADPWQSQAIHTLVGSDTSAIVDGPPGTGKSQTIANLIAALIASGKTVLFVAEKRAALDVVLRRLSGAGLGHLVLDLHGADTKRTRVYQALQATRRSVSTVAPPVERHDAPYVEARGTLVAHDAFMHDRGTRDSSPFELLSSRARYGTLNIDARSAFGALRNIPRERLRELRDVLAEAAQEPGLFFDDGTTPWSSSSLRPAEVSAALDTLARAIAQTVRPLRDALAAVGLPWSTIGEIKESSARLFDLRGSLRVLTPAVVALPDEQCALATSTMNSPFASVIMLFSSAKRDAVRAVNACRSPGSTSTTSSIVRAVGELRGAPTPFRTKLDAIKNLPESVDAACTSLIGDLLECSRLIGREMPSQTSDALSVLESHLAAAGAAHRAAYLRSRRESIAAAGLTDFLDRLKASNVTPRAWGDALERLWIDAQIEELRPQLASFNGRMHDAVVETFGKLDDTLKRVAAQRVLRRAADRFVQVSGEARDEMAIVSTQLEKMKPRKPLRELFKEAPRVVTALAPCVMASPLSVSQFLPATQMFDVVIFDEGSQVTPGSAVSAIMRGKRVVIAGDERQLPPTDFFGSGGSEEDDDDDQSAVEGVESVLTAVRPFSKPLGLRVHYRSRDEHLIAFSNHWLYGGDLVTFPGSGGDGQGVRHVLAPPGGEIDEESSGPEVQLVVSLILEHARERPNETLGVIALGLPHTRRIDAALAEARKTRPELDAFFSESSTEAFFVKNLERVQGDERDAIILSFGYGRTKTGAVSHNFGPINRAGGERRLNVAVTRAKSRLTLVSSFRSRDLDRSKLTSDGAKLLAKYLAYAESNGKDLGRDGEVPDVPLNDFEAEIKSVLEARTGIVCVPQYGVGQFRIDLAARHPTEPGRFVLAIECDGATYHSTPTARMRDRLRQQILEGLGWKFCRIWSTDWFNDREREVARVHQAYQEALVETQITSQTTMPPEATAGSESRDSSTAVLDSDMQNFGTRSGRNPVETLKGTPVDQISEIDFRRLIAWIQSDQVVRTDDEIFKEMMEALDYKRRGTRIAARFDAAIRRYRGANRSA